MINQTRMERYQQAIEEATTIEERPARQSALHTIVKAIKITAITAVSIFALLLTALIVDISNDTPEEKAAYGVHVEEKKQEKPAQQVLPTEVKVAGTQSIDYKRATLRQILSQQYPLVSAYEVKAVNGEVYSLVSVDPNSKDSGDFALEGQYQVGDIVVVMWAGDSDEIAGSVKLASAGELDVQWNKGGTN